MCRRKREDAHLTTHIQQVFRSYRGIYGSPRIHAELKEQGWRCSRKRIARLMQENGMNARRKQRRPITTKSNPGHAVFPNLLQQDFTAERPNQEWTGDITYIPTMQGWLYLAVILDLYSRMVVGWSMSAHCDEALVEAALRMALARRHPALGTASSYGPWQPIHEPCLSPGGRASEDGREHEQERQLLR